MFKTAQKPPKHVFFTLPNLPLSSSDTHSEESENITKTPYLAILIDLSKILTKTRIITQNWIYTGLEIITILN